MLDGRALLLTAVVVGVVVSASVAYSGPATAVEVDRGDASPEGYDGWNTATGSGDIGDEAVVFQGEGDVTFVDNGEGPGDPGDEVEVAALERTSSGTTLQMPVPEDAQTGTYSTDGDAFDGDNFGVRVRTPEIEDFDVNTDEGEDQEDETIGQDNSDAEVAVDYNFADAEDLVVTVEDGSGLNVTGTFIEGPRRLHPTDVDDRNYDVVFDVVDLETVDEGEYTITVEGVDDLDHGQAVESTTVTVGDVDENATVSFESSEVSQGEPAFFSVDSDAPAHLVTLERGSYRSDDMSVAAAAGVFRDAFDTEERGIVTRDAISLGGETSTVHTVDELADAGVASESVAEFEAARDTRIRYSYAVLETSGRGALVTDNVADGSVDVTLYGANATLTDDEELADASGDPTAVYGVDDIGEATLTIPTGSLSIATPRGEYVVGDEVSINGSASANVEDVVVYARDDDAWERVTGPLSVGPEDRFDATDFVLSADAVSTDIFTIRGTYMIGAIAAGDADVDGDGAPDDTIETGTFSSGVSASRSLRVVDQEFGARFEFVDGQVAVEDATLGVRGTAPGQTEVDLVLVGSRGNVQHEALTVDDDGSFEATELDVDTGLLAQGPASAHVLSPGRDGVYGSSDTDSLDAVEGVPVGDAGDRSAAQVSDALLGNTVEDTGSDDAVLTREFRIAEGTSRIGTVGPAGAPEADTVGSGGTLAVAGTTNRVPGDTTMVVEVLSATGDPVVLESTQQWGSDGRWNVSLALGGVEPGNYTVRAGDGISSDRQPVRVVAERDVSTPTPTPPAEVTPTPFTTPQPASDRTPTPGEAGGSTPTPAATPTPTATGQSGPGFGVVAALVGVVVAALLARKRE